MARCINALDLACYCQTTASGCTVCLKNVPSPVFIEELSETDAAATLAE